MLTGELSQRREHPTAVELIMVVTRGEDDRLSGTVHPAEGGAACRFSGTLELMRVFEELVPVARDVVESEPDRSRGNLLPWHDD